MYKCFPKLMTELHKAIHTTSAMRFHVVACPFCGHKLFSVYEGTTGFIETKCSKCKKIIPFNLVSMRRTGRRQKT